jgi:PAS domain S-box-containing protein
MKKQGTEPVGWKDYAGVFVLLLLSVFATELATMELFYPMLSGLGTVTGGLIDATTVTVFCAIPLWFYLFRVVPEDGSGPALIRPRRLLAQALSSIFLIEFLVMQLLPYICPTTDTLACDLTDAALTALGCAVPLWRLLFRPELRKRMVPVMDTPLRLYVLLLFSIFFSDLLQELLLPYRAQSGIFKGNHVVDSFLTTLFGAPLIWLLVARPLKNMARSEKARVTAVYAQVIDAIVVIDDKGLISSFNPAAERIFGWGADDILGEPAAQLLDGGAGALRDLMSRRGTSGGGAPNLELDCRRRDGLSLVMNISISELLMGARPEFLLIMRDITNAKRMEQALRESETRFRQIFHQSEDSIIFFKPGSCQVVDANAKAEKVFGYSKGEFREGGFERICATAEPPVLSRAIAEVSAENQVSQDFRCRRKDQEEMIVSLRGKIVHLQGVPVTYCTFRDITERVRMEERTREIHSKLIQTNKMTSLGLLVSGVAHEINNPNNFIMANCELLSRISEDTLKALDEYLPEQGRTGIFLGGVPLGEVGEHTRRLLGGIATGSHRVNDIVSNLKGFARQELNQPRREVDLNQVVRSAVSLMHHELIKFTDHFHLALAPEIPPIQGHGQQLGQVFINLLMNACQALPGKGSGIWLSTALDPEGAAVTVTVRDEGLGMQPQDLQHILEPFFTTKMESGGTGLGLSISDSIIKEHGGSLEFSSQAGQGTTFTVRLPIAGAAPAHEDSHDQ